MNATKFIPFTNDTFILYTWINLATLVRTEISSWISCVFFLFLFSRARPGRSMYMVARSREREVKCSNKVAMIEYPDAGISAWVQVYVQVLVTPRYLQSRIVSKHCRCVRCILVIAKGSGIVSRGQERRYSRGRSLDGILDADRLMQRENGRP